MSKNDRNIKVAFIGGIFTLMTQDRIISQSKGCIQYAADTLQKCYIEGLVALDCNFEILNLPYIGNYPKFSRIYHFDAKDEKISVGNKSVLCHNIGFNNLILYKNWSRYKSLKKALNKWCEENHDSKLVLVVYAAHTPFMKAVKEVKQKHTTVRTILIVPDLPEFMGQKKSILNTVIGKYNSELANRLYGSFNGYIFLSEQMTDKIDVVNKEYEVIEGIFSDNNSKADVFNTIDSSKLLITYSGTLAKRYGVMNLVNAFRLVNNKNAQLMIIGDGDSRDLIKEASINDSRIVYLGQMPREKVLGIQHQSTILVNPRTSDGEFTKYSFPSKTMEYLASGVPCVFNPLPGIPFEYLEYSFQPENESIEALANCLNMLLDLSSKERKEFGDKAKNFILQCKTPKAQCMKLQRLINRII